MQAVPPEVWAGFERRLDEMRVPTPQRSDYRKSVRFYLKGVKQAAARAAIPKRVSPHTFRHTYASHLLLADYDLQTIQKLLGHSDIKTTMICLQTVPSLTLKEAKSPLDLDPSSPIHAKPQSSSSQ